MTDGVKKRTGLRRTHHYAVKEQDHGIPATGIKTIYREETNKEKITFKKDRILASHDPPIRRKKWRINRPDLLFLRR